MKRTLMVILVTASGPASCGVTQGESPDGQAGKLDCKTKNGGGLRKNNEINLSHHSTSEAGSAGFGI
jgi:hypothetical protein